MEHYSPIPGPVCLCTVVSFVENAWDAKVLKVRCICSPRTRLFLYDILEREHSSLHSAYMLTDIQRPADVMNASLPYSILTSTPR